MARRKPVILISAAAVVLIVAVAGSSLLDFVGLGSGDGSPEKSDTPSVPAVEETASESVDRSPPPEIPPEPTRPLRIVVRDRDYFIAARKATLTEALAAAAKVPAGSGPTVVVERTASARASAEELLTRSFEEKGIDFAWAE